MRWYFSYPVLAAGLAVGSSDPTGDLDQVFRRYFEANFPSHELGAPFNLTMTIDGPDIRISASARVDTTFLKLIHKDTIEVHAEAKIVRDTKGLEVVLVMDNTGSMASYGRMTALKAAATDLVNILFGPQDILRGGSGDDEYRIGSRFAVIEELAGEGTDRVVTEGDIVAYTLGAELEHLRFEGTGDFTGTGNALANSIEGGDGDDTLRGVDGGDSLLGRDGDDRLEGGDGNDTLDAGAGTDALLGGVGDDVFAGGDGNDVVLIRPITPAVGVTVVGGTYNGQTRTATGSAVGSDGVTPVAGSFAFTYYAGNSATGTPLAGAPVHDGPLLRVFIDQWGRDQGIIAPGDRIIFVTGTNFYPLAQNILVVHEVE